MKIKKSFIYKSIACFLPAMTIMVLSCSDEFLDQPPLGSLNNVQTLSAKGAQYSLISAYAALKGNAGAWDGEHTNWVFGSIVGGDAHKGSDGGDQASINPIADFTANATNAYFNAKWVAAYDGVNRANTTINLVNALPEGELSAEAAATIIAEARFLRGFFHFEAKKMWNNVPYVDETVAYLSNNYSVPNDTDIWPLIEADFEAAMALEPSGMAPGRVNKWAAAAFLAKAKLYQKDFAGAKVLFDDIIANGVTSQGEKYDLLPKFHDNWDRGFDNSKESVFAYQASVNDGSSANNANFSYILNWPYNNGPGGCCGFFQPSFDLANSYRTEGGLPLLESAAENAEFPEYDSEDEELKTDMGVAGDAAFQIDTNPVDPRLDWTVGRRGVPYLDWGNHPGTSWVRLQSNGGPYSPKKHVYANADAGELTDGSSWTKGLTSTNFVFMRFADVLLMAAECEVGDGVVAGAGTMDQAQEYVNRVRARAANEDGFVKVSDDVTKSDWQAYQNNTVEWEEAANYEIAQYPAGHFESNGIDYAIKAIHHERKMELAMEGHRFFDLVRWGETTEDNPTNNPANIQSYLDYEGTKLSIYNDKTFVKGTHEYYPIPQTQIDLMLDETGKESVLEQNNGY